MYILKNTDIGLLYKIYDTVYNYNYRFRLVEEKEESITAECIKEYKQLITCIDSIDFKLLMEKLKKR